MLNLKSRALDLLLLSLLIVHVTAECHLNKEKFSYLSKVICSNITIEDKPFTPETLKKQLENIKILEFSDVKGTIGKKTLKHFLNLKTLVIGHSKLEAFVPNSTILENVAVHFSSISNGINFDNCPNLKRLALFSNHVLPIPKGSFSKLGKLQRLYVFRQNITVLSKHFFEGLFSLKYLEIDGSSVKSIEENAFTIFPNLLTFHIKDDTLKIIKENTFKPLRSLQQLQIYGKNLQVLNLDLFTEQNNLEQLGLPGRTWVGIHEDKMLKMFPKLTAVFARLDEFGPEEQKNIDTKLERIRKKISFKKV